MNHVWQIQLLGRVCAFNEDGNERRFQIGKVGALLGTLAHKPYVAHTRESLIDAIWPKKDIGAARSCLRTALHALRDELEPPGIAPGSIIRTSNEFISLDFDRIQVDVINFRASMARADEAVHPVERIESLREASRLYTGDFLPGYFMDWALVERDQLSIACARVLGDLAHAHQELGEFEQALELALRAVAFNPERETSHQVVMELYGAIGQPGDVARQYRTLQRTLKRELGKSPSPRSLQILREFCGGENRITRAPRARVVTRASSPKLTFSSPPASKSSQPLIRSKRLPAPLTRFFGHEDEVRDLVEILAAPMKPLERSPIVSLTGTGGSGKTRLALEIARRYEAQTGHTVYFVSLAESTTVDDMLERIIGAVCVTGAPTNVSVEKIATLLTGRKCLLLLDTLDRLVPQASDTLAQLQRSLDTCRLLVTSRQKIGVPGTTNVPVRPLDIPLRPGTPDRLMEFASVQLYCDRAKTASPGFELTSRNAGAVASICRLLEGIPLAIELAASRSGEHTPVQIVGELRHRFNFLVDRRRAVESPHKTMEGAIAWSYNLLPKQLQRFLCSMSVFRGGWTADAAKAVSGAEDAIRPLEQLIDRSLVYTEHSDDEVRFRMFDTVREFAELKCKQVDWELLSNRHTSYFFEQAETSESFRLSASRQEWVDRVDRDYDNMIAVLERERGTTVFADMIASLSNTWHLKGHTMLALKYLTECVDNENTNGLRVHARVLQSYGSMAMYLHKYPEALRRLARAETLARESGDYKLLAEVLTTTGFLCQRLQDYRTAERIFGETLSKAQQHSDRWMEATAMSNLGDLLRTSGKLDEASMYLSQSYDIFQEIGDLAHSALALNNIGTVAEEMGDFVRAKAAYQRSLAMVRETGNAPWVAILLGNVGEILGKQGKYAEGLADVVEAMNMREALGDRAGVIVGLERSSLLLHQLGRQAEAVRTMSATASLRRVLKAKKSEFQESSDRRVLQACTAALGSDEVANEWANGEFLPEAEAVAFVTQTTLMLQPSTVHRDIQEAPTPAPVLSLELAHTIR